MRPPTLETRILRTDTEKDFDKSLELAAAHLRRGDVAVVPTETVYGLAANALEAESVEKIFAAKNRPPQNPIIVHVVDESMARDCVAEWTEVASALAKAFWPGPLTLVLPKAENIPGIVTAGGGTVGVRLPNHPFMQELIPWLHPVPTFPIMFHRPAQNTRRASWMGVFL